MGFRFNGGSCCCGRPIIYISTTDSSVYYAHLCNFETAGGLFPPGGLFGPAECPLKPSTDPDGSGVGTPKANDIARWNADRLALADALDEHGDKWPLTAAILAPRFRCWAGTLDAIRPNGEPNAQDSHGDIIMTNAVGTGPTVRLTFLDLQFFFDLLVVKQFGFPYAGQKAEVILDVDDSGSTREIEWSPGTRTTFITYLQNNYPNFHYTEKRISNYLTDGEDWLRRMKDFYLEIVNNG
jgi:hypothetical protein